jgi:hypothetical protein
MGLFISLIEGRNDENYIKMIYNTLNPDLLIKRFILLSSIIKNEDRF